MSEVHVKKVSNCARCGEDHENMTFAQLERPMTPDDVSPPITWTHWAPCPTNGQPILMRNV